VAVDVDTIHSTCVAIGQHGVLIRGPSKAGKSDLALRLLHTPLPVVWGPVRLVSDDRVCLSVENACLVAHTAPNLEGKLEVRGIGIVPVETLTRISVQLVVDGVVHGEIDRMPDDSKRNVMLLSCAVPRFRLELTEPSAIAKVLTALEIGLASRPCS
jgi:serine kinase of HPr protein (carbohydrate metabolism regulator)